MAVVIQQFDGDNLRIVLASGLTTLDVAEMYSEWKEWAALSDNLKYPEAFLPSVGGEELTPGVNSGSYFFLNNTEGWRIRPAEEDASILFNGNLAPTDSSKPLVVPTIGDFTSLIVGLQPITQNVSQLLELQQETSYDGVVYVNTLLGTPGTAFPIGTASEPVSNLADAKTICDNLGFREIHFTGNITLDQDYEFFVFKGESALASLDVNGFGVQGTIFRRIGIYGDFSGVDVGGGDASPLVEECTFAGPVTDFAGNASNCTFTSTLTIAAGQDLRIFNGASNVPGTSTPIFTFQTGDTQSSIRNWNGGLQINGLNTSGSSLSLDINSGNVVLDSSNTAGTIVLRGVGTYTNNLPAGPTLNKKGFLDALDLKLIKALDAGNVTITGSSPFVITVLDPDDNVTVLATFEVTPDGRTRTRTS